MRALLIWLVLVASQASAQPAMWQPQMQYPLPPPIDLGIMNIPQNTPVWCWAAVAQQVIYWRSGQQRTPEQCELVSAGLGMPAGSCCRFPCMSPGTFHQVAHLIGVYTQRPSSYAFPADPMTLYHTLRSGRPVLLQVATGGQTTHVVLLRGMHFQPANGGEVVAYLHINDPMSIYPGIVPFSVVASVWMDALVIN